MWSLLTLRRLSFLWIPTIKTAIGRNVVPDLEFWLSHFQTIGRRSLLGCSCKILWNCSSPWRWEILHFLVSILKIYGLWDCRWLVWNLYIQQVSMISLDEAVKFLLGEGHEESNNPCGIVVTWLVVVQRVVTCIILDPRSIGCCLKPVTTSCRICLTVSCLSGHRWMQWTLQDRGHRWHMRRVSIDNLPKVRIHRGVQPETLSAACRVWKPHNISETHYSLTHESLCSVGLQLIYHRFILFYNANILFFSSRERTLRNFAHSVVAVATVWIVVLCLAVCSCGFVAMGALLLCSKKNLECLFYWYSYSLARPFWLQIYINKPKIS